MKKILVLLLIIVAAISASKAYSSVKGEKVIGVLAGYNTCNNSAIAGVAFQYRFSEYFRIAPNVQYTFKNKSLNALAININCHAPLRLSDKFNAYPLAGLTYQSWRNSADENSTITDKKFGFNVGGGIEFMATATLKITLEGDYSWVKNYDHGDFFIGVGYLF